MKETDFTRRVTEFSIYKPNVKLGFYFNHFTRMLHFYNFWKH